MSTYHSARTNNYHPSERRPYEGGGYKKFNHGPSEKENYNHEPGFQGPYHQIETKLLPNEMRISSQGDMRGYVNMALDIINQGFNHVKMVGRGQAVPLTEDLVDILQKKAPYCIFQVRFTTALNKKGYVCDEIHVMMSKKSAQNDSRETHSKFQTGRDYQRGP